MVTKSSAVLLRYNHMLPLIYFLKTSIKLNPCATECASAHSQIQIYKNALENSITAILKQGASSCLSK